MTATLVGRAILPAATFTEGPASGALLGSEPLNGQILPFDSQPVQGFSGIADGGDGTFLVLSDNGYGSLENSADFHLRVYRIRPDLEAHHVFPQKFATDFRKAGINIHDPHYGAWWPAHAHRGAAAAYNDRWRQFFGNLPSAETPSSEVIFQFGRELAREYGLHVHF